jgi:hypothetical protein
MKTANSVQTSVGGKVTIVLGGKRMRASALQIHGQATSTQKKADITHAGIEALDLSSSVHSFPKCEENNERGGNQ